MVKPRLPELETCFGCCSLRTGTLIISIVSTVLGGLLSAIFAVLIIYAAFEQTAHNFHFKVGILVILMALLVSMVFEVVSVFLLIGVKQYKETHVLSWAITITAFNFVQTIMVSFVAIVASFVSYILIIFVLEICAIFYIALVVYSYYREIRRLKNVPQSFRNEA